MSERKQTNLNEITGNEKNTCRIMADDMHFSLLNEKIRGNTASKIEIENCMGQRYIASGLSGKTIEIDGIPGNALGSYLNGATVHALGNVQDATGDTMNAGTIVVNGNAGDATGYAMRGGAIYVRGNTGYRAGIHMKAYEKQQPLVVIGGCAGSFLGEYQAGGKIIVLGLDSSLTSGETENNKMSKKYASLMPAKRPLAGAFCGTGMHGGAIYLRANEKPEQLPPQVTVSIETGAKIPEIQDAIEKFCGFFKDVSIDKILDSKFVILKPNSKNPYKQLYMTN